MDKQLVGELPDITESSNDDEIMVITDSQHNQLRKEKISNFIKDLVSNDENNGIKLGTDNKLLSVDASNADNITSGILNPERLPNSGVTEDTYVYPDSITVDKKGRVTKITNGTPGGNNADKDLSNITEAGKDVIRDTAGSGFSLFDVVEKDHILSFEESMGFGLLGTYVYKDAVPGSRYGYPDFYNECVAQKEAGTEETITVGDVSFTATKNPNGHIFYDIADKATVDEIFAQRGEAWFYGVDTENERVFLPRGTRSQYTVNTDETGDYVEAGLPNITGTMVGDISEGVATGALKIDTIYSGAMWQGSANVARMRNWSLDASLSNPIYGNSDTVQPYATKKLLYIVVGNVKVQSAASDVVDVTTTENDTLPLFYNFYAKDEDMADAVSFVKSTGTFLGGNLYPTAYEKLVARVGTGNVKAHTDDYTDYDFVVNQDEMTFRLPLKNGKETMFSTACKGNGITLGLTNGATNYGVGVTTGTTTALDGYTGLYGTNIGAKNTGTINTQNLSMGVTTDFTKSGIVPHIEVPEGYGLYYKLLNAVVNQELVDFAHIQTELNTKLSRSNKEEIVSWGMPDYTAGVAITTSTTNQTIESDGYLYLVADSYALNRPDYFYINDIQFMFAYTTGVTSYTEMNSLFAPVLKGDRLRFSSPEHAKVTLYPLKGAN